jgi:hypothetical protein
VRSLPPPRPQQDLQHRQIDTSGGEADEEETGSLECRLASASGEGPRAVTEEIIDDGDEERPDCCERMRDAQAFSERCEDPETDQEPEPPTSVNLTSWTQVARRRKAAPSPRVI